MQAKLGAHHLAYLRAIAEGLPQASAAARYLGHDPRDGAVALRRMHHAIVDRVRALARRRGDARWRLIGLSIRPHAGATAVPPVDQWAREQRLEDFGQAELLDLHAQAFPPDRKALRDGRLRSRQLDLLQSLAQVAAEPALPHHRLDAWLPEPLCRALLSCGLLLLADLQARVQAGGRWWKTIPRIGATKAQRLAQQLETLLPGSTSPRRDSALAQRGRTLSASIGRPPTSPSLPGPPLPGPASQRPALPAAVPPGAAARADGIGFALTPEQLAARDLDADVLAVRAWIQARAGSPATARAYRRELGRFLLFLDQQRLTLSRCNADDCLAYMALLQNLPADWTSRRTAPLGHNAWSPFAGPLSLRSQRQAVVVVGSCFAWLVAARYLPGNPWVLVNRRSGDDRDADELASRAFAPALWLAITVRLEALAAADPAAGRMVFLLHFLEATGLRAAELLGARLGDFHDDDGRLLLQVHGKGRRNRVIPVAGQARRALDRYLALRGIDSGALAEQPQQPLLASLKQPDRAPGYRSLYSAMKTWLDKAIAGSDLSWADKVAAARASPHWLRHTCGTRALERGVPLDVVGQLLGHADPRTTARYTRAQIRRVADAMDQAFA
ncbi:MAG: tyrosine-type recombinase/integrase [Burkholderiaceae bacterium]|nr:tyrosine-type recombinase/integrase [Burkholderiaceae bacterium]